MSGGRVAKYWNFYKCYKWTVYYTNAGASSPTPPTPAQPGHFSHFSFGNDGLAVLLPLTQTTSAASLASDDGERDILIGEGIRNVLPRVEPARSLLSLPSFQFNLAQSSQRRETERVLLTQV